MNVRQLTQVLNELPVEFVDCEIEFGDQLSEREGVTGWVDKAISAIYANADRGDIVLCSRGVGDYLAQNKPECLRLIPIFREDDKLI